MNDEAIAFHQAPRHSHSVKSTVRDGHGHHLWAKRWKWRKADCFELNLFATTQAFAEITQRDGKSKSSKRTTRLHVYLFRHILVFFADVCAGNSGQKIRGEFTLRLSILRFFPGPFFLHQFWLLSKLRLFLIEFPIWEPVSDNHM